MRLLGWQSTLSKSPKSLACQLDLEKEVCACGRRRVRSVEIPSEMDGKPSPGDVNAMERELFPMGGHASIKIYIDYSYGQHL